jgi:hypothetical protein
MMSSEVKSNGGHFRSYLEDLVQDPVSWECLQDPWIDSHGHTFDLNTVKDLVKKSLSENLSPEEGFICPLSREWVNLSDLYPNRMVRDIAERVADLDEKHMQILKELF